MTLKSDDARKLQDLLEVNAENVVIKAKKEKDDIRFEVSASGELREVITSCWKDIEGQLSNSENLHKLRIWNVFPFEFKSEYFHFKHQADGNTIVAISSRNSICDAYVVSMLYRNVWKVTH